MRLLAIQGVRGIAEHVYERWHLSHYGRDWMDRNHCPTGPDDCCKYHTDAKTAWGHLLCDANQYSHRYNLKRYFGFTVNMTPDIVFDPVIENPGVLDRLANL